MEGLGWIVVSFLVGCLVGIGTAVGAQSAFDRDIERRLVWTNRGRAYKLTPIEPTKMNSADSKGTD